MKTIEHASQLPWRSELTAQRFRQVDIEEAVREGVLVPHKLHRIERLQVAHGSFWSAKQKERLVWKATQAAQMAEMLAVGVSPFGPPAEREYNLEVYTGINAYLNLAIGTSGSSPTTYAHGNARLCVGNNGGSAPSVAYTDTDLASATGGSNRYCNAADTGNPTVPNGGNNSASAVLTCVSTFASGNANFAWYEMGMDSGGASGTGACSGLFNHLSGLIVTKASGYALALTFTASQS
jgi:hypothetical protein